MTHKKSTPPDTAPNVKGICAWAGIRCLAAAGDASSAASPRSRDYSSARRTSGVP
jgi:hypothetical protein